ncbi:MAG: hypothetical protein Q8Q33_01210 [Chlamydiota bacterium]|nr:hypothetical protein [Chlamydiota bacterium]
MRTPLILSTVICIIVSFQGGYALTLNRDIPLTHDDSNSQPIRPFTLKNRGNTLTLTTEWEDNKSRFSSTDPYLKDKILTFSEALEMNYSGSIYHPNLFDFNTTFEIQPEQKKEESIYSTGDEFNYNLLRYYRVQGTLLKEKPYTLSLFASQRRWEEKSDIFERQTINGKQYGGTLFWKNNTLPMSLSYRHSDQEIERAYQPLQDYLDNRLTYQANSQPTFLGKSSVNYTYRDFSQKESTNYENQGTSHRVVLRNTKDFGPDHKKTLDTFARYYHLTGDRIADQLNIDNNFTMTHTDHLKSRFWYIYTTNDNDAIHQDQNRFGSRITHRLYESLTSTLEGEYITSNSENLTQNTGTIRLREDYRKKIGSLGILQAGVDLSIEKDNRDNLEDAEITVIGESHNLTDSDIHFLNENGVVLSSIIVYNRDGTTYYENIDYEIIQSGAKTEIKRIPNSRIYEGQEILLDYKAGGGVNFSAFQQSYYTNLILWNNRLRLYFRHRERDYIAFEGAEQFVPDTFTDSVYGTELRIGPSTSTLEYQDYQSDQNNYTTIRLRENIAWDLSIRTRLSANASYTHIDFESDQRDYYTLLGTYFWRLSQKTSINLESGYRWQQDTTTDLEDIFSKAVFRTKFRRVYCEITYEYENRLLNESHIEEHYGYIKITRFF